MRAARCAIADGFARACNGGADAHADAVHAIADALIPALTDSNGHIGSGSDGGYVRGWLHGAGSAVRAG